jgi:hypothetical protein
MKLSEMMPSKYLKTSDVDGEVVVTVKELKKTNLTRLGKALGDDTEFWIGQQVLLYVDDEVQYGSDTVSGLRIRAAKNPASKARTAIRDDDVNAKLRAAEDPPF